MRKFLYAASGLLAFSLLLTGCGNMPKMTEEQSDVVSEYATSLLLKYDADTHSRLINTEEIIEKYNKAWDEYNEAKEKYEKELAKEEKKKKQEEEQAKEEINESDNSPNDGTGGATVIDSMSIAQFIGVDYDISYSGYSLVKTYPEDGVDYFFSMDATSGHDLLVVKLNATNLGDAGDLDIMSRNLTFKLSINGDSYHSSYKTILDDDFSEYVGSFNAGESKTLVLIAEVEEGKEITSIDLRISDTKGNTVTKQLLK